MPFKKYPIFSASRFALSFLAQTQTGTVHSVYRKTINLNLNGQLLALQAKDSPLSPISLITGLSSDEMEQLGIAAGDSVRIQDSEIQIGQTARFYLNLNFIPDLKLHIPVNNINSTLPFQTHTDSAVFESSAEQPYEAWVLQWAQSLETLESQCLKALCSRSAGSFELLFSDPGKARTIPFLAVAEQRLKDTLYHLEQKQWEEAAQVLVRLIGLGLGLTPGGDDFLCGILAGLILCRMKNPASEKETIPEVLTLCRTINSASAETVQYINSDFRPSRISNHPFALALETQIRNHLCDTNDISAAFLRCALNGQFSLAVNRLPSLKSASEILSVFSEIGHSSGTDTLCGIYYILKNRTLLHETMQNPDIFLL